MKRVQQSHDRTIHWRAAVAAGLWLMSLSGALLADSKHIVYIEASTVNRWKLDGFATRTGTDRYRFEVLREYDFDKSRLVKQAVESAQSRPDAVVVQECSVYFPDNLEDYKRQYRGWIADIRARGLLPVIATVVPPAASQGWKEDSKAFIKVRILGKSDQFEQVLEFNDWLRALGKELNVAVFDLEQIVRVSAENRHMRDDYNEGDGIHLNPQAYDVLDREFKNFLNGLSWKTGRAQAVR